MTRWTCPSCDREFGARNQAHVCVPGNTLDETFARYPRGHRDICDAVIACLSELGPLHVDPVSVGVFLKTRRKLAEVRPKQRWVSLELVLPDRTEHPRITRHVRIADRRVVHVVRLGSVDEVDEQVRAWLLRAYDAATD